MPVSRYGFRKYVSVYHLAQILANILCRDYSCWYNRDTRTLRFSQFEESSITLPETARRGECGTYITTDDYLVVLNDLIEQFKNYFLENPRAIRRLRWHLPREPRYAPSEELIDNINKLEIASELLK